MAAPVVLVLASPYVYACLIEAAIRRGRRYEVVAPPVDRDPSHPAPGEYAAVVTTIPVRSDLAPIVLRLPRSFLDPVEVQVGDLTVPVAVDPSQPLDDVALILEYLALEAQPAARLGERWWG